MIEQLRQLEEKFNELTLMVLKHIGNDLITLRGYDGKMHVETVSTLVNYPHGRTPEAIVAQYMPKCGTVTVTSVRDDATWLVAKETCCASCGHTGCLRCTRCNLS